MKFAALRLPVLGLALSVCLLLAGTVRAGPPNDTAALPQTSKSNGGGACTFRDDFSGSLDASWSWLREDASHWSLSALPGFLRITTQTGDLYSTANGAKNLLLHAAPGDFEIRTRLEFTPTQNYHSATLLVYQDDDNYARVGREYSNGSKVTFMRETNAAPAYDFVGSSITLTYLRITRLGQRYTGFYSADGLTWITLGTADLNLSNAKVGLTAWNSNLPGIPEIPAYFDYFCLTQYDPVFLPLVWR